MNFIFSSFSNDKFKFIKDLITNCDYTYFLLGGAGNGKSTVLSKVADNFSNYKVDYLQCSYDNSSLDGILIDDKILLFDGSYPHNILPKLHKIDGETVDLSTNISNRIIKEKNKINKFYTEENRWKILYQSKGEMLRKSLVSEIELIEKTECCNVKKQIDIFVNSIEFLDNDSLITDLYLKGDYLGDKEKFSFRHKNRTLAEMLLRETAKKLVQKNIKITKYHNIYCDELLTGIETKNAYIGVNLIDGEQINLCENCEPIAFDRCEIIQEIIRYQAEAVVAHKKLENCYKPFIDFEANDEIIEKLVAKIKYRLKTKICGEK